MDSIARDIEERLRAFVSGLKQELFSVRTNRPNTQLIENIKVEYAGQPLTIKQLGTIGVQLPRDIVVSVWDKAAAGPIAKAIEAASLGLSASVEGATIRVRVPALTDERRAELIRFIKGLAEKVRIRVRAERDEANKKIVRAVDEKKIGEDQKFKLKEAVQKIVDAANAEIETLVANKTKEISE